jgi:PadR family transcriptional regulator, regulatory protein PadR
VPFRPSLFVFALEKPVPEAIQVQLKKGVLELCVLALLSRGDGYAYDIASTLAKGIDMGEGTIYPLMRRLQNEGLVDTYLQESASGPPRKYYRLTAAGRASFTAQRAEWESFARAVEAIIGDTP